MCKPKIDFLENFSKFYNMLYNDEININKELEAVSKFEDSYKENEMFRTFVLTMAQVRGDIFSSDRECAAFVLAYKETADEFTRKHNEVA